MDARELPAHPCLEQYQKQAKELVKGKKAGDPPVIRRIQQRHPRLGKLSDSEILAAPFPLADAQFTIAREHGFDSWRKFTRHIEALNSDNSTVSRFEAAADAIVNGDEAALKALLRENPKLIRARSTRQHHATLLHYISANGVEDYRQKTPRNAVKILEILLDAGAGVNDMGMMYGGSTTLGLVATSVHPARAGVQEALMERLVQRGAALEGTSNSDQPAGSLVNACLANGRPEAAAWLAGNGARLDLEGAAGVGRLEVVKSFFDGKSKAEGTSPHGEAGLLWACEYGHTAVVEFLLREGVDEKAARYGATALHWASLGGHPDVVRLLLDRKAPVDTQDERFGGTPLGWALHGWLDPPSSAPTDGYYRVVAQLVGAGAAPAALAGGTDLGDRVSADPRMIAALRGEASG